MHWAILTGEYPPQSGGVADYTSLVARGLAERGDTVTIFAPSHGSGAEPDSPGIRVVRLPDHFGPRGLWALETDLSITRPDRILIQYVPHAYGFKALNLPFALWVAVRAQRFAPVWVMFHEVNFPFRWRPWAHALLGLVQPFMARLVVGRADRVFVAIPAWGDRLKVLCPWARPAEWLPVPCNVATNADPRVVEELRRRFAPTADAILIGHFGTYGAGVVDLLKPVLAGALKHRPEARALLLGRGAEGFRGRFLAEWPEMTDRVSAVGELSGDEIAAHLRACDLLVQPYPDGVSSRRTSVMAGLANGVPVVSNRGALSEALWSELAESVVERPDAAALLRAVEFVHRLSAAERVEVGRRGWQLYQEQFRVEKTIDRLRASANAPTHGAR